MHVKNFRLQLNFDWRQIEHKGEWNIEHHSPSDLRKKCKIFHTSKYKLKSNKVLIDADVRK